VFVWMSSIVCMELIYCLFTEADYIYPNSQYRLAHLFDYFIEAVFEPVQSRSKSI